jgi:uncharacterized protein
MKFHQGEIAVQTRAGVRDIAEDVGDGIYDRIPEGARNFLSLRNMVVIGSVDPRGQVWASVVTGAPGLIQVLDDQTVRIGSLPPPGDPLRENLTREGHVALLLPDLAGPKRLRLNGLGRIEAGAIVVHAHQVYGNCRRYIQERLLTGKREFADDGDHEVLRTNAIHERDQEQISRADTFFIATDHPDAGADVSHKGGKPGFVRVIDDRHLAYPDYNGNSMFNSLGNIAINPAAGLLFIDFDSGRTLQLTGRASIDWNPERAGNFAGAERVIDFVLTEVAANEHGFPLLAKFRQYSRFNP